MRTATGDLDLAKLKFLVTEKIDESGLRLLQEEGEVQLASATSQGMLENEAADKDAVIIRAQGRITERLILRAPGLSSVPVYHCQVMEGSNREFVSGYLAQTPADEAIAPGIHDPPGMTALLGQLLV